MGSFQKLDQSSCNNAATKRAARRLSSFYDDILAPCGLRSTQVSLLQQLDRLVSPKMTELATALVMDRSALSHTIRPLERDGFVRFSANSLDRRVKLLVLTDAGREKLEHANKLWEKAQERFEATYGREEAATLRKTLDVLSSLDFSRRISLVSTREM
jgi:DNA-binding MarR family transcriptional regulator